MPLADIAFLVRSASVSGPFGGGTDGLLSARTGTHAPQQKSLNHLVGECEQHRWNFQNERFRSLQVDDQLEPRAFPD
jgi:hypothetical protein